jgi:transcriptional regulator with XRE-family HTH domain
MCYTPGEKVGAKLQALRKQNGIKQETVARKLKVSRPEISKIENGRVPITIIILLTYCELINSTSADFFQEISQLF